MIFSFACQVVAFTLLSLVWSVLPQIATNIFAWLSFLCCFVYASYLLGNFLDQLPRFRVSSKNKAVFITGCDSGFGYLLAHRLDSLGYKVFAGCLSLTSKGATQLNSSCSTKLMTIQIDVTDDDSVKQAYDTVVKNLNGESFWALVNNAGVLVRGELEWVPMEGYKKQFEVNTLGVVRVTKTFLPLLRRHHGRVVTTASFGGRCSFTGFASYCMTKHATASFCDGLRMEMKKFGVTVISVEPFSYSTPMTDMNSVLRNSEDTWSKSPESIKADYGNDYIDVFKDAVKNFNKKSKNLNVHEVIDSQVEAVTATSPHFTYTVGSFKAVIAFWFIQRMPRWLAEYSIRKYVTFDTDIEEHLQNRSQTKINGKKDS